MQSILFFSFIFLLDDILACFHICKGLDFYYVDYIVFMSCKKAGGSTFQTWKEGRSATVFANTVLLKYRIDPPRS
jgi:hypothetical protein